MKITMEFKEKAVSFLSGCTFTYCLITVIEATRVTPKIVLIAASLGVVLNIGLIAYDCGKEFSRRKDNG